MVLQQYFSYILVVSFIGGGNWRKMGTDVVSSNLDQGEMYNIMWSSLSIFESFTSESWDATVFSETVMLS